MEKRNNIILLISLSVICLILIVASTLRSNWIAPVRKGVGIILTPIQSTVNKLGVSVYDAVTEQRNFDQIAEENKELQSTIDDLMAENTRLEQDNHELDRLRELYELDQEYGKYEKTGARVIAKSNDGWFNQFKIDKGTDDGIEVDMNVMAGGGLVGIVTEAGPNYAIVRSIIDDTSKISAMALQSSDECIVTGSLESYESGRLFLQDIQADSDVKDGDKIVTSNISSKYMPGILIGYASGIEMDSNNITKSGYLIPVADFDKLQEVLVITTVKK